MVIKWFISNHIQVSNSAHMFLVASFLALGAPMYRHHSKQYYLGCTYLVLNGIKWSCILGNDAFKTHPKTSPRTCQTHPKTDPRNNPEMQLRKIPESGLGKRT